MKFPALVVSVFLLSAALCPTAPAQAAVEYGLGASRAATMTAPIGGLGKQIGGVWDGLNKTVKADESQTATSVKPATASKRSTTAVPTGRKTASDAESTAAAKYEDARHIEAGIAYDEMVRRFGRPSMEITTGPGGKTLLYAAHEGSVSVEVENDKVVKVTGGIAQSAAAVPVKQP
jgi:hypothetical protein